MDKVKQLKVNGVTHPIEVDADRSLLSVLRDDLDLTGPKYGCGEGQCGACKVLINGQPAPSCITPVGTVGAAQITTIEGLASNGRLHPLQQAFLDADAMQCAYCTSGMIIAGVGLLASNPDPSEEEIIRSMEGNICRCGTYRRIITAIQKAARANRRNAR